MFLGFRIAERSHVSLMEPNGEGISEFSGFQCAFLNEGNGILPRFHEYFQEIHEEIRFLELKVLEDFTKICVFHQVRQSPRPVNNMDNFSHLTVSQDYGTTLGNHTKNGSF